MITRNRIERSEKQAAFLWQQMVGKQLTSTDNDPLGVIYPGRLSVNNGPDFRDAVIVDGFRVTKGDVEVHVRCSDWYRHRHDADARYNNVILHVVLWQEDDCATLLESGKVVPVICLSQVLRQQAYLLPRRLPCFQIGSRLDKRSIGRLLSNAGEERFEERAKQFQTRLKQREAGEVLFHGMMRALGYARNTAPFEELADRMPLSSLECTDGLALRQALLLGTAGLLPSQRRRAVCGMEKEVRELEQMWRAASKGMETMREGDWHLSHVYPNNSPVRRIIAVSHVVERYRDSKLLAGVLQLVWDAPLVGAHRVLEKALTVASQGYWQDHFDFGAGTKARIPSLLGNNKAGEIAVNVILPFVFGWGELTGEVKLREKAVEVYRGYRKLADNYLTRHMMQQLCLGGLSHLTACQQQGLIHIFRNFCREGRCGECPLVD